MHLRPIVLWEFKNNLWSHLGKYVIYTFNDLYLTRKNEIGLQSLEDMSLEVDHKPRRLSDFHNEAHYCKSIHG